MRDGWIAPEHPKLRTDLRMERASVGDAAIFEVRAPGSTSTCKLYDIELTVARMMDGERDLQAIAAASGANGLPVTVHQLQKFIRELAAYGFIENAPPLRPAAAEVAGVKVVPRPSPWSAPPRPKLRSDVKIDETRNGSSKMFRLRVPGSDAVCTLYDFEMSLAQLMDGQRDLQEIAEAGRGLGVPVNVERLEKFIRQLVAYRLVEPAEPQPLELPGSVQHIPKQTVIQFPNPVGPETSASSRRARPLSESPARSPMPATVRFAEAPISVPLPPKQAPRDSAHQSGRIA